VVIQPMTEELAKSFGLSGETGALVGTVMKDSPAEKGGIKRGDVIIAFNGESIDSANELPALVATTPAGKAATITVLRNGKKMDLSITLGNQKDDTTEAATEKSDEAPSKPDVLGFAVATSKTGDGVTITQMDPDCPAAMSGVRPGDLLVEINGTPVKDVATYNTIVGKLSKGALVRLLVARDGSTLFVAFTLK